MAEYLNPPPYPAAVHVIDRGGYVEKYKTQTELYKRTGQTLVLIQCNSACTMALSLPYEQVCVYSYSKLKFHAAYDKDTKQISTKETAELFSMYPLQIQQKLGTLEKEFKTLTGHQLIKLGVRACK